MKNQKKDQKKDEVKVTVIHLPRTPEEDIRIRAEITKVLYEKKMLAIQRREERAKREAEAAKAAATETEEV